MDDSLAAEVVQHRGDLDRQRQVLLLLQRAEPADQCRQTRPVDRF